MRYALAVIGASLGGLGSLRAVLSALPADFRLPLALVQHRTAAAGGELAFVLGEACALPVREAQDKEEIETGVVFIGPPGYHLLVEDGHFALSTDAAVHNARSSIDVLFESAAESFGARAVGVLLTGTGRDGARGLAQIAARGGAAIVEAPETALAGEMPQAGIDATPLAVQLAVQAIGPQLLALSLEC